MAGSFTTYWFAVKGYSTLLILKEMGGSVARLLQSAVTLIWLMKESQMRGGQVMMEVPVLLR